MTKRKIWIYKYTNLKCAPIIISNWYEGREYHKKGLRTTVLSQENELMTWFYSFRRQTTCLLVLLLYKMNPKYPLPSKMEQICGGNVLSTVNQHVVSILQEQHLKKNT